jgi:hypothetical protein
MGRPRIHKPGHALVGVSLVLLALLVGVSAAWAAPPTGRAITRGTTGVESVQKGVWELGHEQMLLVRWFSGTAPDGSGTTSSQLSANFIGGIAPRYFIINNLAVGVSVNAFLGMSSLTSTGAGGQTVTAESKDIGLLAMATVNYYLRLGFGLFFAPGIGLGGFYGQRFTPDPTDPGRALQTVLVGGAGRLDLGFVFFASRHVSLKAGLDVLFRVGSERFTQGDPASFSSVEAGIHAGIAYSF